MRLYHGYILSMACVFLLVACGTQKNVLVSGNSPDPIPRQMALQTPPDSPRHDLSGSALSSHDFADAVYANSQIEHRLGVNIDSNDDLTLLRELASWVGVPYKHANNDKTGTDCSGLSFAVFKKLYNKSLERTSDGQFFKNCVRVGKSSIRQGDLLFFAINKERKISHVGIYLKNDKFIHASSLRGVVVSDLNDDYYSKYFYAAGRVR